MISKLKDSAVEFIQLEEGKKKSKKSEDKLRDSWDTIQKINICILGVPEGEEREKVSKNLFKDLIVKTFPNLGKEHTFKSKIQ